MSTQPVVLRIAADPGLLLLMRSAVRVFAAREDFTIDQVDDVRMAVEEAAVQLLRRSSGLHLELAMSASETGLELRVSGEVTDADAVFDPESFSWTILRALADEIRVETATPHCSVILSKHRTEGVTRRDDVNLAHDEAAP